MTLSFVTNYSLATLPLVWSPRVLRLMVPYARRSLTVLPPGVVLLSRRDARLSWDRSRKLRTLKSVGGVVTEFVSKEVCEH